jgi:hypothetical protein
MLLLGSVVLVAGVSVGAALIQDSAHFLRERALQRLDAAARESTLRLEEVFDGLVQDLRLLASLRSMRAFAGGQAPDRSHIADLLQHALLKHPWYIRVRLVGRSDLDGEVVAVATALASAAWWKRPRTPSS